MAPGQGKICKKHIYPKSEVPSSAQPPSQSPPSSEIPVQSPPSSGIPPSQLPPTEKPPSAQPPSQSPPTENPPSAQPPSSPCIPNPKNTCPNVQPNQVACCPNQTLRSVNVTTNITINGKVVDTIVSRKYCCSVVPIPNAPPTIAITTTTKSTTQSTTKAPCVQSPNYLCPTWQSSVVCCPEYKKHTQQYDQRIVYQDGTVGTRLVTEYCCSNGTFFD